MHTVEAGNGRISVQSSGSEAVLSELSSSYPLKLLSPESTEQNVCVVYTLTYGGGLVAGDRVRLLADVQGGSVLVMLTQGSTKVFKTRQGQRSARPQTSGVGSTTSQRLTVDIGPKSTLILLPDPVTCFRAARYSQLQTFRLHADSTIVLLDWISSGRKSQGEDWSFSRYYSLNEVWVNDKRIARDALLLEEQKDDLQPLPHRTLADRLAPYSCYATVLMYGPLLERAMQDLSGQYQAISVFKHTKRPELIWSLTDIADGKGRVLRVSARQPEDVRRWLGCALRHLESIVGKDTYRDVFG